jgi:multiple sugar transport system substrate-binding protein
VLPLVLLGCTQPPPAPTPSPSPTDTVWEERGPITLAAPSYQVNALQMQAQAWNQLHPDQPVTIRELPNSPHAQYEDLRQRAAEKSGEYTIAVIDLVWLVELVKAGALAELTDKVSLDGVDERIAAASSYRNDLYAAPYAMDASLLYYRRNLHDFAAEQLASWTDIVQRCQELHGAAVGQPSQTQAKCFGAAFQTEEAFAATILDWVEMDGGDLFAGVSTASQTAFSQLSAALRSGTIPSAALDWDEEAVRGAFNSGGLLFAKLSAAQAGAETGAIPVPWPGGGALDGYGLAVSAYGRNLDTAGDVIAWLTQAEKQTERFTTAGIGPVLSQAYQEPPLVDSVFAVAVAQAKPRLQRSNYHELLAAIAEIGRPILSGQTTASQALPKLDERLKELLSKS